jgi:hypothetical protein
VSALGQTRSFGDVGSNVRFFRKRTWPNDLRVHAVVLGSPVGAISDGPAHGPDHRHFNRRPLQAYVRVRRGDWTGLIGANVSVESNLLGLAAYFERRAGQERDERERARLSAVAREYRALAEKAEREQDLMIEKHDPARKRS